MKWKEKVKAAHDMVSALCRPRGSAGSREWIMSIPARPDYDPDLVITSGLRAAAKEIATLTAERDRLAAENAAANATLDRLREVVPEGWHWCADCEKMTPPDDEDPDFCGVCECENYWHRGVHVALQAILYPPETTNDDR